MTLHKAWLIELDDKLATAKGGGKSVPVQFNPESLKVTYANQLVEPKNGDKAAGTSGLQFVGQGSTKLALQLWFDVTAMNEVVTNDSGHTSTGEQGIVDDVRRLTQHVVYFMTPQKSEADPKQLAPPGLRFEWGSFAFNGIVEAMEEALEFFSPEGKPLRASITMTLTQQKILQRDPSKDSKDFIKPTTGHKPLAVAKAGNSLQGMAAAKGKGGGKDGWQGIAAANGIEDPLRMPAGSFVDLNASASVGLGLSASVGLDVGAALRGGGGAAAGLNASLGGAAGASLSLG